MVEKNPGGKTFCFEVSLKLLISEISQLAVVMGLCPALSLSISLLLVIFYMYVCFSNFSFLVRF